MVRGRRTACDQDNKSQKHLQSNLFNYATCTRKISVEAYCLLNDQTLAVQRPVSANKIPLKTFLSHINFNFPEVRETIN